MKTLAFLASLFAFASLVAASPALRSVQYDPTSGTINLSIIDDGFSRPAAINIASLPGEQQSAIGAVFAWLGGQLPAGFASVEQIILQPGPLVPAAWGEAEIEGEVATVPTAWRRTLDAAITGSGSSGEMTKPIAGGSAPEELSTGLIAIWDALEAAQDQ